MADIIPITQARKFTLAEANALLPLIRRITQEAVSEFIFLEQKLKHFQPDPEKSKAVEQEIGKLFDKWGEKIVKLGARPKGIWRIDFDNGQGYYCWRYDEEKIGYFHGYREGFGGRLEIQ